jgi:hypothetical protein
MTSKTDILLNQLKQKTTHSNAGFGELILPNHSGENNHGIRRIAPINNKDLVNKEYVDSVAGGIPPMSYQWETDNPAAIMVDYLLTHTETDPGTYCVGNNLYVLSTAVITGNSTYTMTGHYTYVQKSGSDSNTGTCIVTGHEIGVTNTSATGGTHRIYGQNITCQNVNAAGMETYGLLINASGYASTTYSIYANTGKAALNHTQPIADNTYDLGTTSRQWRTIYLGTEINFGNFDVRILYTSNTLSFDIPVSAEAANTALDFLFKIDGTTQAGLFSESDGAGSGREAVWKIPYYSADYGVGWASPPNPTPTSLANGSMFVAYNSNGAGSSRVYIRSNGSWRYSPLL